MVVESPKTQVQQLAHTTQFCGGADDALMQYVVLFAPGRELPCVRTLRRPHLLSASWARESEGGAMVGSSELAWRTRSRIWMVAL